MNDMPPGDNRLKSLDPEKLLVLDVAEIDPLLSLQYAALAQRTRELEARAGEWLDEHLNGIRDDNDNSKLTDLFSQVRDHATGEIEAARQKVKSDPLAAARAIDGYFNRQRQPLETWLQTAAKVQKEYMRAKLARERREREAHAEAAQREAEHAIAAARKANTPDAIEKAIEAEQAAEAANENATASVPDLTRTYSTLGSTTSASRTWAYELTDMVALCRAVGEGKAPVTFVLPADSAIKSAIRQKHGAIRECPGLHIFEDITVRRRGA